MFEGGKGVGCLVCNKERMEESRQRPLGIIRVTAAARSKGIYGSPVFAGYQRFSARRIVTGTVQSAQLLVNYEYSFPSYGRSVHERLVGFPHTLYGRACLCTRVV